MSDKGAVHTGSAPESVKTRKRKRVGPPGKDKQRRREAFEEVGVSEDGPSPSGPVSFSGLAPAGADKDNPTDKG